MEDLILDFNLYLCSSPSWSCKHNKKSNMYWTWIMCFNPF